MFSPTLTAKKLIKATSVLIALLMIALKQIWIGASVATLPLVST
jgi:hypothetical protein